MRAVSIVQMVAFLLTFGGAALLASKQLRRGRGDRRGALRVGLFVCIVLIVFWCLMISRLPHHAAGFLWIIQRAVGMATWVGLMYFGVEPYVRRRWPRLMVSWSRALAGRWRDPLVGRDILVGLAAGLGVPTVLIAIDVFSRLAFDMSESVPASYMVSQYGARQAIGYLFMNAFESLNGAFCMLVAPLVVMVVLRKFVLALSAVWIFASYLAWMNLPLSTPSVWSFVSAGILAGALFLVAFRCGLLASVFAHFAMFNVVYLPGTTDVLAWNGRPAVIGYLVMVCLALFGLFIAMTGRRRLSKAALMQST